MSTKNWVGFNIIIELISTQFWADNRDTEIALIYNFNSKIELNFNTIIELISTQFWTDNRDTENCVDLQFQLKNWVEIQNLLNNCIESTFSTQ